MSDAHPSLDITGSDGSVLDGRRIVLCVAGSVAAYKAIELARLLMRHGAEVTCVASGAACRLVTPEYLRWATGGKVITELTGDLEHIRLADYNASDMILVYPGTANTVGKMANGIDDTPVSTVLATAMGSGIPIVIALAMHGSMYENTAVRNNIGFLKKTVQFIEPASAEGKAKLAEPQAVLQHVLDFYSSPLRHKRVLVTAGATAEPLDPVRSITNSSTGVTGMLLVGELARAGAEVTVIYGHGSSAPARGVRLIRAYTAAEMARAVKREVKKCEVVIMAAAVSDYTPAVARDTKMDSDRDEVTVRLVRTHKILDRIRGMCRDALIVGFKAETDVTRDELTRRAKKRLEQSKADVIIANDIGRRYCKDTSGNRITIVDRDGARHIGWKSKQEIARIIKDEIESRVS